MFGLRQGITILGDRASSLLWIQVVAEVCLPGAQDTGTCLRGALYSKGLCVLTLCACAAMQNESQNRRWKHLLLLVIRLGGHRVPVSITRQFRALPGEAPLPHSFTQCQRVSAVCWRLAGAHRQRKIGKLSPLPTPQNCPVYCKKIAMIRKCHGEEREEQKVLWS